MHPLQTRNKISKGSTNDKAVNNDTDVVDNEDKMVAVEDVVTVKIQNNFNDSKISCGIFCEGEREQIIKRDGIAIINDFQ